LEDENHGYLRHDAKEDERDGSRRAEETDREPERDVQLPGMSQL
jgi:hypothetical protein